MFICTGNSCRSQMAEGFARHFGGKDFEVLSAGVVASYVNPAAIRAMAEIGIDISKQTSDPIDPELIKTMDCVVTVCDHAKEFCPVPPPGCKAVHWSIEDPFRFTGRASEETEFARIRDDLGDRIKKLLRDLKSS